MNKKLRVWLLNHLTPKNTEEVKPGLFIQKYKGDNLMLKLEKAADGHPEEIKYDKYRVVVPGAWKGVFYPKNLLLGKAPLRGLAIFAFILFLAWAYWHDTSTLVEINRQLAGNLSTNINLSLLNQSQPYINLSSWGNFSLS